MTSKILLPHDGTDISDKALEKSKEFAKALNAEIYILHIVEHSPLPPSLILDHDRQWIAESRRNIAQKLKEGWIKMAKEKINPILEKENIKVVIAPVLKLYRKMFTPKNMVSFTKQIKKTVATRQPFRQACDPPVR